MKPAHVVVYSVLAGVMGALAANSSSNLSAVSATTPAEEEWSLPSEINRDARAKSYRNLAKRFLGQAAIEPKGHRKRKVARGGKSRNPWSLLGVIHQGGESYALIQQKNQTIRLPAGSTLPDGRQLVSVEANGIKVEERGETHWVYLYGLGSSKK